MNESSDSGPSSPSRGEASSRSTFPGASSGASGGPRPVRCDIFLQNPNRYPEVEAAELRPWLAAVLAELAPEAGSFAVRFCGDRAMRATNREYRGFDKTTDVLSFAGDLPPRGGAALFGKPAAAAAPAPFPGFAGEHLGDLLIAVPTAVRQAAELGHGVGLELRVLLLHGILHCLGYDHEVDDGTMNRVEAELRRRFVGEISFIEGSIEGSES